MRKACRLLWALGIAGLLLVFVSCEFSRNYDLRVSINGSGTVSPSGGNYDADTWVTLTATPSSGWEFSGWSGDASGSNPTTRIVMDSDKVVVANFTEINGDNDDDDDDTTGAMIIPDETWTCGMPDGIPSPENGTLVFSASLSRDPARDIGNTPYGRRLVIPVDGGAVNGDQIRGNILGGAIDFDLHLPSGAVEHESRYVIRTSGGDLIYMRNAGVADGDNVRFVADFEAPSRGSYRWLNQGTYIGTRTLTANRVSISVYEMPNNLPTPAKVVQTPSDNQLVQQDWECMDMDPYAREDDQILRARVGIGSFLSVGNSKYGSRRIIPITGGTFSGDISGSVDEGGADFQLTTDAGLSLEARYTLRTNDGEYILVRNCGNFAVADLTVPLMETRVDGPYNWLNDADFVGTITPGMSRVTITVFDQ